MPPESTNSKAKLSEPPTQEALLSTKRKDMESPLDCSRL